jgi:NAD(P)-dependent dehydrogenase (short-subunit alcohol dehydrogenase family)
MPGLISTGLALPRQPGKNPAAERKPSVTAQITPALSPAAMQKSILITGCSSGIGLCAALKLQDLGYQVIASVRHPDQIAPLQQQGLKHVIQLDLADSVSIDQGITACLALTGGRLFALFNNGAFGLPGAVEDLSREALRYQFETNLFGTHELTQKLLPVLLQESDARIVQNSSVLGFAAMPYRGAYVASKFALEGLSDCLRMELKSTGVKVVLLEPGPIDTAFRSNALHQLQRWIPLQNSRHSSAYGQAVSRLEHQGPAVPFTLPPEAVVKALIQALESPRPQARYFITVPTHLLGLGKRLLSNRWLDRLIALMAKA